MTILRKFLALAGLAALNQSIYMWYSYQTIGQKTIAHLDQLGNKSNLAQLETAHSVNALCYITGWVIIAVLGIFLFNKELNSLLKKLPVALLVIFCLSFMGCSVIQPFEPIKLEVIQPNEEAFLLPFTEDVDKQVSSNTEEYLKRNLVFTKQVKIPQQWVQQGYQVIGYNGEWRDAAILMKVDKSPITREWTADPTSGTSDRNEAVWIMTADQVEFSTGWTCTARIASRDDAVLFLHNYPNGSLKIVLDTEVLSKLKSTFGLEVTDLPMEKLRKDATPHIKHTIDDVTNFFKERGITITNLGITGGFIYKDPLIQKKMVEVFTAEQERSIAVAATAAQEERNKKVVLEATSKADALMKEKKAEADSIRLVADAKSYEIEKAKENSVTYMSLKRLEVEKAKIEKWDGRFPSTFMGNGEHGMDMLLQVPTPPPTEK